MKQITKAHNNKGFTLIELLIVVIIVAILAAVVIPQFKDSSIDAKEAGLQANLATMRSAIELYKLQHNGKNPGQATAVAATACTAGTSAAGSTANSAGAFTDQLTLPTNVNGEVCKNPTTAEATTYKYGPYIRTGIPADPLLNVNTIVTTNTGAPIVAGTTGGWATDVVSGQFVTNNSALDARSKKYSDY